MPSNELARWTLQGAYEGARHYWGDQSLGTATMEDVA